MAAANLIAERAVSAAEQVKARQRAANEAGFDEEGQHMVPSKPRKSRRAALPGLILTSASGRRLQRRLHLKFSLLCFAAAVAFGSSFAELLSLEASCRKGDHLEFCDTKAELCSCSRFWSSFAELLSLEANCRKGPGRGGGDIGGRSSSKGLRHFSMKVCEKVEGKGRTTYNEVADELVNDLPGSNDPGEPIDAVTVNKKDRPCSHRSPPQC